MRKLSKSILAMVLCLIMLLGTVAVGGSGAAEALNVFSTKVSADDSNFGMNNEGEYTDSTQAETTENEDNNITYIDRIDVNIGVGGKASVNSDADYYVDVNAPVRIVGGKYVDFTIKPKENCKFSDDVKMYYLGAEVEISEKSEDEVRSYGMMWNSSFMATLYKFPMFASPMSIINLTFYGFSSYLLTIMIEMASTGIFS